MAIKRFSPLAALLLALPLIAPATTQQGPGPSYDLVVYGGTASGVMTAIAAARQGASVALVEPTGHLGGMVTGGLSRTDFGNPKVVGAIAMEFYRRVGREYGEDLTWYGSPHVAEKVIKEMLAETSVSLFLNTRLREKNGVEKNQATITAFFSENGIAFIGRYFADCSYEGDLMAQAKVSYTWGREGESEYGETLAGVREKTPKHQFKVNVPAKDASGKLLPEISPDPKGAPGSGDKKVQAYNFRLCMTTNTANRAPFPKPEGYDPARYQLLVRLIEETTKAKGAPPKVKDLMHPGELKEGKTDTNNNGAFSTDYLGGNWDYPEADYAKRQKIWDDHYNYVAGFLYFLANDTQVPQVLRDEMNTWGLAKDEFTDTANWPRQLYVREARRMIGEYVMSQHDIQTSLTKTDTIGMGSYNSDSHNVVRIVNDQGFAENEGDMQVGVTPYEIPFRCLLPNAEQSDNLVVPVCLSATHVAYSTLRMEPVYMIMGQAAGTAVGMAAREKKPLRQLDIKAVQDYLKAHGAVLSYKAEAAKPKPKPKAKVKPAATP